MFEQRKDFRIELQKSCRNVGWFLKERDHFGGDAFVVMRLSPVCLVLAFGVIDQTREPIKLQTICSHFQLHGKIELALKPRFNNQLSPSSYCFLYPALLHVEQFRFKQTNRIAARDTERLLDYNPFITPSTNSRNRSKGFIQGGHTNPDFIRRAKPICRS